MKFHIPSILVQQGQSLYHLFLVYDPESRVESGFETGIKKGIEMNSGA